MKDFHPQEPLSNDRKSGDAKTPVPNLENNDLDMNFINLFNQSRNREKVETYIPPKNFEEEKEDKDGLPDPTVIPKYLYFKIDNNFRSEILEPEKPSIQNLPLRNASRPQNNIVNNINSIKSVEKEQVVVEKDKIPEVILSVKDEEQNKYVEEENLISHQEDILKPKDFDEKFQEDSEEFQKDSEDYQNDSEISQSQSNNSSDIPPPMLTPSKEEEKASPNPKAKILTANTISQPNEKELKRYDFSQKELKDRRSVSVIFLILNHSNY